MTLDEIFNVKATENGDIAFTKVSDNVFLDILFLTEYYQKHLNEVPDIGASQMAQIFAMFIRDPRFGLGRRDLGRKLMAISGVSLDYVIKAGRADDVFYMEYETINDYLLMLDWLKTEIEKGNELIKKWMPRYSSKRLEDARFIARHYRMNKQQYGHFIKCNTTENKMSRHNYDEIDFEHVPSLAMLKYAKAFAKKPELCKRYAQYLEDVKNGKKDLKISTTTVYDIYKNRNRIDADLFFDKVEKISGSWIPIVDTSGSMFDNNDSIGKALALGHYLAKCSTYCPNKVVSFSSRPKLITLGEGEKRMPYDRQKTPNTPYNKEINSMYTGDCSNTDFGAVMRLLVNLDMFMPDYFIVLSDMEFDEGSHLSKEATMNLFKSKGYNTKIIWWNLNSRNITVPEMDNHGNVYLSGYNPMLLKYLQVGFDGKKFLYALLKEYSEKVCKPL